MRRMIYNDDSQGVYETQPGQVRQDLEAWVDKPFARLHLDTYVWCICFPDICMHRTRVGEVYGADFAEPPNSAAAAITELHAQGTDVLEVVAARARQQRSAVHGRTGDHRRGSAVMKVYRDSGSVHSRC